MRFSDGAGELNDESSGMIPKSQQATRPELAGVGSSDTEAMTVSLIGTQLGDYQILRKLGRGGMADVYVARQMSLGRDVALKILRSDYARDKDYVERFRREARAAAKLNHPNIVQVYEVGTVNGLHYIAQELIDGENLRQRLDRHGAIGAEEAVEILVGVASALEMASESGITHRDIKPENLMCSSRGIIKVADFGLARLGADVAKSQTSLTQAGLTLGTPRYMSPEQVQGKTVDVRSDLYSLGVTMYHVLAGRPPFDAEDPLALALMHLQDTPQPLDRARDRWRPNGEPDLPEWIIAIVTRLMNKLPQDRFQSPSELLDAIRNEASHSNLGGFGVGTAAATIRLQRATDRERSERRVRYLKWAASVLLPVTCTLVAAWFASQRPGRSVSMLLNPESVTKASTVQEQFLNAVDRNDEVGWRAISLYFPPEQNTTNAGYHAKAGLQLASLLVAQGQLLEADQELEQLSRDSRIDPVYQAIALARRCSVLEALGKNAEVSDVRRELQSVYAELKESNPGARQLVDRVLTRNERLQLGLIDS
jgi:serine/threonine-protein kinase